MRAIMVAAAMAAVAGAASAQGPGTTIAGGEVRSSITPTVPANAPKQAKDAVIKFYGDNTISFRAIRASEVASVRRSAFDTPIEGPATIVCGQYGLRYGADGYAWFFVALKRGRVLWLTSDHGADQAGDAFQSCQNAGLTSDRPNTD